ncbi:glycosyltransferase family 61 protein [Cardinium endosymbiont of Philonthus spinipes]|uniref:glycosyltransferase family 61 protein n=1 Tax=Cardinium endosymbiont of Philonthus spinipes TaxID=3077941 RepID=UPI00313E1AD8
MQYNHHTRSAKAYILLSLFSIYLSLSFTPIAAANITQPTGCIKANELLKEVGTKTDLLQEQRSSQFILSLIDGVVVNEGGIVTNNGKVLIDTQTSYKDQHRLLKKGRNIADESPRFFKGNLAVISSPGQENWYHFLLQVLPRLKILKESKITFDKIYINNLKYPFQKAALAHILKVLQIPKEKILAIDGDSIIQAKQLIVPSVPFIPCKGRPLPGWLKTFLRNSFLNYADLKGNKSLLSEKIYISRAQATIRRIANEKELTDYLKKRGFKVVYLEHLNPFEQAYLFNNAKIIMGPHGSGFANLIFAQPTTKVIEIDHGTDEARSFYKRFCAIMDCIYHPFYVDHVTEDHLEEDMHVDIAAFETFLNRINLKL